MGVLCFFIDFLIQWYCSRSLAHSRNLSHLRILSNLRNLKTLRTFRSAGIIASVAHGKEAMLLS